MSEHDIIDLASRRARRPKSPRSQEAGTEHQADTEVDALTSYIREAYERIMATKPAAIGEAQAATKFAAIRADREVAEASSIILINNEECHIREFKERIVSLLRDGPPYFEMKIPGALALRLGNQYMEGSYNLDIFVEAAFIDLFNSFLKAEDPTLNASTGTLVCDDEDIPIHRDFYTVGIRNMNAPLRRPTTA